MRRESRMDMDVKAKERCKRMIHERKIRNEEAEKMENRDKNRINAARTKKRRMAWNY